MKIWQKSLLIVPALVLMSGATASSQAGGGTAVAILKGLQEVPPVSSVAAGVFTGTISADETTIEFQLHYANLEGTVTQAHIHFGQVFVAGGISVWLCGNPPTTPPPGTPTCPDPGDGAEVTGTINAASVIGPTGQGIAPGDFVELIAALRKGAAYANVHSTKFPGGEIRGQIAVH